MRENSRPFLKEALSVLLVFMLCLSSAFVPEFASASNATLEIKDAEAAVKTSKLTLTQAQTELDKITKDCDALNAEVAEKQAEIDDMGKKVIEAEMRMLNGREALSNVVCNEYKNNSATAFINLILGSMSFEELTQNVQYISQIMSYQAGEISAQKELKEDLEQASSELNAQVAEQEAMLNQLENKQDQAAQIVDRVSDELDANTEKLDALKKQAEEIKKQQAQNQVPAPKPINNGAADNSPNDDPNPPATDKKNGPELGVWTRGKASAYGGLTDPNTDYNGKTAFGHVVVREDSTGVAVPMAWANYRSYRGHTVEIVYETKQGKKMTAYATVDDCGYMGGGERMLDLQPGIFRLFGFNSCNDWGVRYVTFRIL